VFSDIFSDRSAGYGVDVSVEISKSDVAVNVPAHPRRPPDDATTRSDALAAVVGCSRLLGRELLRL
jgi:hypothetical protein